MFDQVIEYADAVGISSYPYFESEDVPPEDYFDRFADTGLPVLIAETGFPADTVASPFGEVSGDPGTQAAYLE